MHHSTRMLLIPEEIYLQLSSGSVDNSNATLFSKNNPKIRDKKGQKPRKNGIFPINSGKIAKGLVDISSTLNPLDKISSEITNNAAPEAQEISHSRKRLETITGQNLKVKGRKRNSLPNDEHARHIHYAKDFKRMQKLKNDLNERPVRVEFVSPHGSSNNAAHSTDSLPSISITAQKNESVLSDGNDISARPVSVVWYDEVMEYLRTNAAKMGIDSQGRVINLRTKKAVAGSKIENVVKRALERLRTTSSAEKAAPREARIPQGYKRFIENIRDDRYMRSVFQLGKGKVVKKQQQSGTGVIGKFKAYIKKKTPQKCFNSFKPELW